jgi:hypothetical protein
MKSPEAVQIGDAAPPEVVQPERVLPLVVAAKERDRRARARLSRDHDFVFGRLR